MSLVLIIAGIVSLMIFPALRAVRQGSQQALTASNLAALMRASAAFAHAHGCLPCPTPAGTIGSGFGRVRGQTTGNMCAGCSVAEGIAPFVSLGLSQATARDGWGRWITMRVDPALTDNFGVVPPTSPCTASDLAGGLCAVLGASQKGLCRANNLPKTNAVKVAIPGAGSEDFAILFVSHGVNGFGALRASALDIAQTDAHPAYLGPATVCSSFGGFERCNANGDAGFSDAPRTEDPAAPFDDVLIYMKRNALIASIGSGACDTAW